MDIEVIHDTHYAYAAPVALAHHLAHLQPLQDEAQTLLDFTLSIDPQPAQRSHSVDAMGNAQCHFSLAQPHQKLHVRASSRVRLAPRFVGLQPEASPPFGEVATRLRYVAGAAFEPATEFAMPSPYVPRLRALRDYGAASLRPGRPLAAAAIELMQRVHADFKFQSHSTDIDTPLLQVLQQRRGVCQDFAHLLAGVLRMWGLPARYVSGYLLTHAPEGGTKLQGADASHAWVQVWCPDTPGVGAGSGAATGAAACVAADNWLDLDPTNNVVPGMAGTAGSGHVRVAVGRDFGDVTPLHGVIRGGGRHRLSVGVSTRCIPGASLEPTDPKRELPE